MTQFNPNLSNANTPGGVQTYNGGPGRVPPTQGRGRVASPLHSLITPEITIPFASNVLPGPDAATLTPAITSANVGYFALQVLDGNTVGVAKFCGLNYWIGPTFNQFYTATFPARPSWISSTTQPEQIAGYGTPLGTGAGLIVALSNDLPFTPTIGQWCAGPALFPWLLPGETTYLDNPTANKQVWGTPFAPGNAEVDHIGVKEGTLRDTPLGWDVPRTSKVWVLIAIDGARCVALGDAGNGIYAPTQGNLIFAAESRRFPLE